MTAILKYIDKIEERFDRKAEAFAFHHPLLAFSCHVYWNARNYFTDSIIQYCGGRNADRIPAWVVSMGKMKQFNK